MNRYGAKCANCGVWVEAGQGRLTNTNGPGATSGRWVVSHIPPCPTPEAKVEVPLSGEGTLNATSVASTPFKVPDGRYTVEWENEYKTVRVTHQSKEADFMPGRALLSFLSGPNNDRDYTRFAHVDETGSVHIWKKHQANETLREVVKVLLGDPKAASQAYARESGCCGICGRTLTTPESLEAGIGPVCAERSGF
jgi:hypothetical protein